MATENWQNHLKWTADLEAEENGRASKHMLETVIPEYILNGPNAPFDTSGVYDRHDFRNQPFPVSPPILEYIPRLPDDQPGHGGYWIEITPVRDRNGDVVPMFSHEVLMGLCQAEFEEQTGLSDSFTTRIRKDALDAAGVEVVVDSMVTLFAAPRFAESWAPGTWPFGGNRLQFPEDGFRATNPHNLFEYVFLRKPIAAGITGYWVAPELYSKMKG
jgi:hypothetical protein